MRSKEEIQAKIDEIDADARFHYPPATVLINAPLALIQVDMKARMMILKWMLKGKKEKNELDKCVQQFIGFDEGRTTNDIIALIVAMGLDKKEWEEIKKDYFPMNALREDEINCINEHFSKQ